MKLIVSSNRQQVFNAERVQQFYIQFYEGENNGPDEYVICADEFEIACYHSVDSAKKTLESITNALTSSLSDVVLRLEDSE